MTTASHGKEYFPSSIYGKASQRVVENGPVPHGGGQYLVGRPYTIAGQTYYPSEKKLVQVGNASWYGDAFHGRLTANGEIYDRDSFTAAHPTMPLPSYARVTNLRNNASMIVRVNDRGPFAANRVMDVSRRVAEALDFQRKGTARIKVEYVGRASLAGSDDQKLYATLRMNRPAEWHEGDPALLAAREPAERVASAEPMAAPRVEASPPRRPAPVVQQEPVIRQEPVVRPAPVVWHEPVEPMLRRPTHRVDPPAERPARVAAREDDHTAALVWRTGPGVTSRLPPVRDIVHGSRAPLEPMPPARPFARSNAAGTPRQPSPPSRQMDLGTIPGADVAIHAPHRADGLRTARSDDD